MTTFTTTLETINNKKELVMICRGTQADIVKSNLEVKKGLKVICVTFGNNDIFQGFGYTKEEAINNAKKVN